MTDPNRDFAKALFGQARTAQSQLAARFRPGPSVEPEAPERDPSEPPRAPDQSRKTTNHYVDPDADFVRGLFGTRH